MTTPELVAILKKNPISVGCGVLSLVLAVAIYLRSDAVAEANAQLDEKSTQADRYAINISNAAQLKEQLQALQKSNAAIDARTIHATDIGINQQYFFKLENDSGVKLTDLRQGAPGAVNGGYQPIAFVVSLQGDFPAVMKFLRGLEDGTHYCRILTASCTGGRAGTVALTLNLELLGRP